VLPTDGPAAPPRANGELLFAAPWESRIFGLTLVLHEAGRFAWSEFQSRLIDAIAAHERALEAAGGEGAYDYYACWLEAFRGLAHDRGWVEAEALSRLESQLAARPHGHDH